MMETPVKADLMYRLLQLNGHGPVDAYACFNASVMGSKSLISNVMLSLKPNQTNRLSYSMLQ